MWAWDGASWTRLPLAGPIPLGGTTMVYDRRRQVMVLFDGESEPSGEGKTWLWDGAGWSVVPGAGPPSRILHAMAYDEQRGVIVLSGGTRGTTTPQRMNDIWEFDGERWEMRAPTAMPARVGHVMVYHAALGKMMVYGGLSEQTSSLGATLTLGETWFLSPCQGVTITKQPVPITTCPRAGVRFSVVARSASAVTYRWRRDGVPIDVNDNPTAWSPTLEIKSVGAGDRGQYSCFVACECDSALSSTAMLTIPCANIANAAGVGAVDGCDDQLSSDDVVFFMGNFFSARPAADLASVGGTLAPDGQYTADDLIAFLAAFFVGCP
jgi:hypothetical protein